MTVAEGIAYLAALPPGALLCFCAHDDDGKIVEVTQVDFVPVVSQGHYFSAKLESTVANVITVAVVT